MNISYHFQNLDSSDGLKDAAQSKVEKLSAHFNTFFSAIVRFKVEKINHIVEVTLEGDGTQFIAEEKATDMYAAIDLVEKTMERQIRRHKEKNLGKMHRTNH